MFCLIDIYIYMSCIVKNQKPLTKKQGHAQNTCADDGGAKILGTLEQT